MKRSTRIWASWMGCLWGMAVFVAGAATALDANKPTARSADKAPAASPSDASEFAGETWYARSRVGTEFGIVVTHYWSKDALFRADTVLAGHPITTIVDGSRYYVYDSALADGAAIERSLVSIQEDAKRGRPFARELRDLLENGGEKVDEGTLAAGKMGYEVYQLTNDNGRRRVMVTKSEPPLPIQVETFVRESAESGILEYAGWQRGVALRDSFFEPPSNVVFEQISYEEYTSRFGKVAIGPAPVYYRQLLHGNGKQDR
jgi:outer membrane lipoprotein-sorting protein